MEQRKYELTDNTIEYYGITLYQIRALKDFGNVHAGDLGGYIESENNLSQSGNAWVYGDARVHGDAQVYGDARVYDDARVYGDAWMCGYARVYGDAWMYGYARVYGDARVCSKARIRCKKHLFLASYVGTEYGTLTVFKGKNGLIVTRGCFVGSVEEFLAKSAQVHNEKTHQEYQLLIEVAQSRILLN